MDFELSSEQQMLVETAQRFTSGTVRPAASGWDHAGVLDAEVLTELGGMGLLGLLVPAEQDGAGLGAPELVLTLEALAQGSASLALVTLAHNIGALALATAGVHEGLAAVVTGEHLVTTSLPLAGLDALDATHGSLRGITAPMPRAGSARFALITAAVDGAPAALLVPASALAPQGIASTLGFCAAGLATAACDGKALGILRGAQLEQLLTLGRLGLAAIAVGTGEAALDEARRYSSERRLFGQALSDFQATQWKLANAATELAAARALTLAASSTGSPALALEATILAVESAQRAADDALQLHGGYGFTREFAVERLYRDAKACGVLFAGVEAQREGLARTLMK